MNDYRAYVTIDYNSIYHHGIKGQKWGRRRYQNEDGSLTPEGRARYLNSDGTLNARGKKELYGVNSGARMAAKGIAGAGASLAAYKTARILKRGADVFSDRSKASNAASEAYKKAAFKMLDPKYGPQNSVTKDLALKYMRISDADKLKAMEHLKTANVNYKAAKALTITALGIAGATALGIYVNGRRKKKLEKGKAQIEKLSKTGFMDTKVKSDSKVTKKVKSDWNNMSDQEFMNKYSGSKAAYAKRVAKYGDPYMNSPWAKLGKKINKK